MVGENMRAGAPDERFRDRSRSAKRLTNKIARLGRRLKSDAARDAQQKAYGKLLKIARTSVGQAEQLVEMLGNAVEESKQKATTVSEDIEHFSELLGVRLAKLSQEAN